MNETMMESSDDVRKFVSGAVRDGGKKPALELISPHALLRLGEWLRFACEDRKPKPYPKRNWEKGLSFSSTVASLERHIQKFKLGDKSEDHVAAILFNAMALAHFEEEIKAGRLPVSLDDMPHYANRGGITREQIAGLTQATFDSAPPLIRAAITEAKIQRKLDKCFRNDAESLGLSPPPEAYFITKDGRAIDVVECEQVPEGTLTPDGQATFIDPISGTCFRPCNSQPFPAPDDVDPYPPGHLDERGATVLDVASKPFTVYLCGPITGKEVDYTWRKAATAMLTAHGIRILDPLRGKHLDQISNLGMGYKGQLAAPEIADRDQMDVEEADVILAHFPYMPPRQSIGSLMEMGAAAIGLRKPVILCATESVFNDHLFCRNFTTLEPDFQQALARIVAMAQVKER